MVLSVGGSSGTAKAAHTIFHRGSCGVCPRSGRVPMAMMAMVVMMAMIVMMAMMVM